MRRLLTSYRQRSGSSRWSRTRAKNDPILDRIRAFDHAKGGGVLVERVNKGYSLFSAATGGPIARLRPTGGPGNEVEVLW